ncbi:CDP-archaeol synthase [Patescibacteria group bacterium]|nr:CDP-archaeol synthase [Patescibacteria group bacterium]
MGVLLFLLQLLWLCLPGALANMAPVLLKNHFSVLAVPIDLGKKWRGKPIFGSHKTFRGFLFGTLAGVIIGTLQGVLYHNFEVFRTISVVDFDVFPGWLLGLLMGFGALFGDAVKSLIKRRLSVAPGKPFFPWDQLDAYFGAILFVLPFVPLPLDIVIGGVIFVPCFHIISNTVGYLLGLKKSII